MPSLAYQKIAEDPQTLKFLGRLYFTIKDRYGVDVNIDDLADWLRQTPYIDSPAECASRYMSALNNPQREETNVGQIYADGTTQAERFIHDHQRSLAGTAYKGFLEHGRGVLFVEGDQRTADIQRAVYIDPTVIRLQGDSPISTEILEYLIELYTTYQPEEESILFLEIKLDAENSKDAYVGKLKLAPATKQQIDADP